MPIPKFCNNKDQPIKFVVTFRSDATPAEIEDVRQKLFRTMSVCDCFEETIQDVSGLLQMSGPCAEAQKLVYGDRGEDYGHPLDDLGRTAKLWSAILGVDVPVTKVPLMMVGLKISRLCNKMKMDSIVDGPGYFETLYLILKEIERREGLNEDSGKG